MKQHWFALLISLALLAPHAFAQEGKVHDWMVDGVKRQAIIKLPAKKGTGPAPVVLTFHD